MATRGNVAETHWWTLIKEKSSLQLRDEYLSLISAPIASEFYGLPKGKGMWSVKYDHKISP